MFFTTSHVLFSMTYFGKNRAENARESTQCLPDVSECEKMYVFCACVYKAQCVNG